jgi:prevent-host-death family protein
MTTQYTRRRRSAPSVARDTAAVDRHVGIRELKAKLSECVRTVKAGGTVIVTEHGRAVARLVPEPTSLRDRLLALTASGDIIWNGQPYKPAGPVARVRGPRTLADLIVEERDRE